MRSSSRRLGAKRVFMHVDPGAVLAADAEAARPRCCRRSGSELVGALIYEKDKTTYRSEIDQALRAKPGLPLSQRLCAGRHRAAARPLPRRLRPAGASAQSYAVTSKVLESLPPEVTEGAYHGAAVGRHRLARLRARRQALGIAEPDSYETQATDWVSLVVPDHRQGQGGDRHRHCATTCARSRQGAGKKVYTRGRRPEAPRRGQGDQLRGRERPLRLHRHRRHPSTASSATAGRPAASSSS